MSFQETSKERCECIIMFAVLQCSYLVDSCYYSSPSISVSYMMIDDLVDVTKESKVR